MTIRRLPATLFALLLLLPLAACGAPDPSEVAGSWTGSSITGGGMVMVEMDYSLDISEDGTVLFQNSEAELSGPEEGRWLITFEDGDTLGVKRVGDALITTNDFGQLDEGMRFHRQ